MRQSLLKKIVYIHIGLSLISISSVALWAWVDPDGVMALVQVELSNTDSLSSIRGAYGGAGIMLVILFLYLSSTSLRKTLFFLTLFWLLYVLSRGITYMVNGPLGDFATQWIIIESILFVSGAILYVALGKQNTSKVI